MKPMRATKRKEQSSLPLALRESTVDAIIEYVEWTADVIGNLRKAIVRDDHARADAERLDDDRELQAEDLRDTRHEEHVPDPDGRPADVRIAL